MYLKLGYDVISLGSFALPSGDVYLATMLQKIGDSLKGKSILPWLILVPLALIFAFWGAM
jgi:hypothetical protein